MAKHKHPQDDLVTLRDLEEERRKAKSELAAQNPFFHHSDEAPKQGEDRAASGNADRDDAKSGPTATMIGMASDAMKNAEGDSQQCMKAWFENMHQMQDNIGLVMATQRRIAEIWMQSWFGLFMPDMLQMRTLRPANTDEDRRATVASGLVMGG